MFDIFLQGVISRKVNMAEIVKFLSDTDKNTGKVYHPSQNEFVKALCNSDTKNFLCPENYIIFDWVPFGVNANDLSYIYQTGYVLLSPGTYFTNQGPSIGLMSLIYPFPCEAGLRIDVFIYGQDTYHTAAHVFAGLQYLRSMYPEYKGSIELLIMHPFHIKVSPKDYFADVIPWEPGALSHFDHCIMGRITHKLPEAGTVKSKL